MRKYSWKLKIAVLSMSIIGCALFAECTMALFFPVDYRAPRGESQWSTRHQKSNVPGLLYELKPGVIDANRYGFRGPTPDPPETPGKVRIICSGDSFTFGWALGPHSAFPYLIQTQLNGRERGKYEVLNFGVAGYSTAEEVSKLEAEADQWKPKLVVLGYVLNDPENEPIQELAAYFAPVEWWQHSQLIRGAMSASREISIKRAGDYVKWLHRKDGPQWAGVLAALDRLKHWAEKANVKVLVAVFPNIPEPGSTWKDYPYHALHEQVIDAARARGFATLDLTDALSKEEPQSIRVSATDRHPNAKGHQIIAAEISKYIRSQFVE